VEEDQQTLRAAVGLPPLPPLQQEGRPVAQPQLGAPGALPATALTEVSGLVPVYRPVPLIVPVPVPSLALEQVQRTEQVLVPEALSEVTDLARVYRPIPLIVPVQVTSLVLGQGRRLATEQLFVPETLTETLRARLTPTTVAVPLLVGQETTATGAVYTTFSSAAAAQEVVPAVLVTVPVYVDVPVYAPSTAEGTPTSPEGGGQPASRGGASAGSYPMPNLLYSPPYSSPTPVSKVFETKQLREVLKL
jgi:hypothetical protein